jgi:hypothetical protein
MRKLRNDEIYCKVCAHVSRNADYCKKCGASEEEKIPSLEPVFVKRVSILRTLLNSEDESDMLRKVLQFMTEEEFAEIYVAIKRNK